MIARPKPSEIRDDTKFREGFARRLSRAVLLWQARYDQRLTHVELATLIARQLGVEPVAGATVSRWISGVMMPDPRTIAAIAVILQCDPGWLAFGELSAAPAGDAGL